MRFILPAIVLAGAPAAAQPAQPAQPAPTCAVTIVRAPDDVRQSIEDWVAAESRCNPGLEVRAIPTEGGYYLIARDPSGRLRERLVPNAQSAGVLVASWAADTVVAPRPAADVVTGPTVAPTSAAAGFAQPSSGAETLAPPGMTATPRAWAQPGDAAIDTGATAPARRASKWLSAGLMFGSNDGGGFRAEIDLKSWTRWAIGAAASYSLAVIESADDRVENIDAKLLAYASRNSQLGRWHLRAALAVGIVRTRARAIIWGIEDPITRAGGGLDVVYAQGTFPTGEASVTLARELGARWALVAGPVLSIYGQSAALATQNTTYMEWITIHRDFGLTLYMGAKLRL